MKSISKSPAERHLPRLLNNVNDFDLAKNLPAESPRETQANNKGGCKKV
jgi:hypothetical protein